jgi:hypothetical protein
MPLIRTVRTKHLVQTVLLQLFFNSKPKIIYEFGEKLSACNFYDFQLQIVVSSNEQNKNQTCGKQRIVSNLHLETHQDLKRGS